MYEGEISILLYTDALVSVSMICNSWLQIIKVGTRASVYRFIWEIFAIEIPPIKSSIYGMTKVLVSLKPRE